MTTPSHWLKRAEVRFGLLCVLAGWLLFGNLHRGDLAGYDDAVYAHEGKQMLLRGDWWNIWLNNKLDFDKPPLFIWLEALSFSLLGINDFAAKFPSALLGLGTIILVYLIARELTTNVWLPLMAMLVMTTTQYFVKYATHAMTDVPFTFFFALAMLAYLRAWRTMGRMRSVAWLVCGLAIACAALTRSYLGWLPLPIIALHLWVMHHQLAAPLTQLRVNLRTPALWAGLMIALGLPLLWFIGQYAAYGQAFVAHHFAYTAENARFIDPARAGRFALGLFEYPWLFLKLYWPWLPLFVGGLCLALRQLRGTQQAISTTTATTKATLSPAALWLLLLWLGVVALPFSLIGHKVLRYLLPAFPACAILCAYAWQHWLAPRYWARSVFIVGSLLLISIGVISLTDSHRMRATEMRQLAQTLEPTDRATAPPVLLYANGQARWDYLHQLIWYGERPCQLHTNTETLICTLAYYPGAVAIVDRINYEQLTAASKTGLTVLAESPGYVSVQFATQEAAQNLLQMDHDLAVQE